MVYILKSALCLAAFYLFYRLLLSRETLHRFNRVALLGVLLLSAVVPLIEVSTARPTGVGQGMLALEQWLLLAEATAPSAVPAEESKAVWPLVWLAVYVAGVLLFLGRNICSLVRLGRLLRGTKREDICRYVPGAGGVWLLVHRQEVAPFSWMRCIVISRRDLEEDGRPILLHELAHIRRGHSWDLLLADLCCFVQWFNPAAWLLKQELQTVHEYEADEAVLRAGVNAREYQLLLIKKAVGTRLYSMANSLNHSKLKKRITMMQKRKSNPWARAKYLYVLPLAAVAVAAFARPEISGESNQLSDAKVTDLAAIVKAKSVETLAPQDSVYDGVQVVRFGTTDKTVDEVVSKIGASEKDQDPPLLIVDGVEFKGDLNTLDPDQINHITVLKNEEAVKRYGEKGAKGVILIATKKADKANPQPASGNMVTVDGIVVDEKSEPVLGAIVRVKGNEKGGVVTDGQGCFRMDVPKGAEVEVMYVGFMTSTVKVQPKMTVVLKSEGKAQ